MALYHPWNAHCLAGSPFSVEPLSAESGAPFSTELLVGRKAEMRDILTSLGGQSSSRLSVWGEPGSGRTSLVRAAQAMASESGFLVNVESLEVGREASSRTLELKILSAVFPLLRLALGEDAMKSEVMRAARYILLLAHGLPVPDESGEEEGEEEEKKSLYADARRISLFDVPRLLREMSKLVEPHSRGFVLHLRYADDLTAKEAKLAERIFREARDTAILQHGYHYLISGRGETLAEVLSSSSQVRSIVSSPVFLEPLTPDEFWEMLQKRCDALALVPGSGTRVPVNKQSALALYSLLEKNVTTTLSYLEQAVLGLGALEVSATEQSLSSQGSTEASPLSGGAARSSILPHVLQMLALKVMGERLSSEAVSRLGSLVLSMGPDPFSLDDAQSLWGDSEKRTESLIRSFLRAEVLEKKNREEEGVKKISYSYFLSGEARLAFESGLLEGDEAEQTPGEPTL